MPHQTFLSIIWPYYTGTWWGMCMTLMQFTSQRASRGPLLPVAGQHKSSDRAAMYRYKLYILFRIMSVATVTTLSTLHDSSQLSGNRQSLLCLPSALIKLCILMKCQTAPYNQLWDQVGSCFHHLVKMFNNRHKCNIFWNDRKKSN